jgi:hypothetical protein
MKDNPDEKGAWKAACIRTAILFVLTIFPPVSTTVFQTCHYDERLGDGSAYLKADYAIEYQHAEHQAFRIYAAVMGLFYCAGIPLCSFYVLLANKKKIQELQAIAHSRIILDDLVQDETRTASVRKRSDANMFKQEAKSAARDGGQGLGVAIFQGDGVSEFVPPETETMRPEEVVSGAISSAGEELVAAEQGDNTAVRDDGNSAEVSKQEESKRERALRRLDRRKRELLQHNPVLSGLSPLYTGTYVCHL